MKCPVDRAAILLADKLYTSLASFDNPSLFVNGGRYDQGSGIAKSIGVLLESDGMYQVEFLVNEDKPLPTAKVISKNLGKAQLDVSTGKLGVMVGEANTPETAFIEVIPGIYDIAFYYHTSALDSSSTIGFGLFGCLFICLFLILLFVLMFGGIVLASPKMIAAGVLLAVLACTPFVVDDLLTHA